MKTYNVRRKQWRRYAYYLNNLRTKGSIGSDLREVKMPPGGLRQLVRYWARQDGRFIANDVRQTEKNVRRMQRLDEEFVNALNEGSLDVSGHH